MGNSNWDAHGEDGVENRRHPRVECDGIADIRVLPNGEKQTGSILNLSRRGCCFLADGQLRGHKGSSIELFLRVKGFDLRVAGVIRHVRDGKRAGIEFVKLSERKREQFEEFLTELSEMDESARGADSNEISSPFRTRP